MRITNVRLERPAAAFIVVDLDEGGVQVSDIWVMSPPAEGSASPVTEEGIRLGSSTAELTAAYPDLSTLDQRGADTWVYAVGPTRAAGSTSWWRTTWWS